MGGLLVIALMIGYVALTIWLLVKVKPLWGKAVVLVAAILILTADDMYYRRQLDAYCKNEAGYKIYDHVSKRAGIVDNTMTRSDFMKSYPLDIVEADDHALKELHRFERQVDGSIKEVHIEKISVPYELVSTEKDTGTFLETKVAIIERQTSKILGKRTDLNYYGGWRRRALDRMFAGRWRVANCGIGNGISQGRDKLINLVFTKD